MTRKTLYTFFFLLLFTGTGQSAYWRLPPLAAPKEYGNLLINRTSKTHGQKPVTFSHWSHRMQYACRVCHFELPFEMQVNATEITEEANRKGEFCGACHNGKTAFGHTDKNCKKCHNGDRSYGKKKFKKLAKFPKSKFGNKINWVKAVKQGRINPKLSILDESYTPMPYNKLLKLEAEWSMIPDAFFPHEAHNRWLDCSNCHPDIFNIKKKTTKHFAMKYILEGRFCGVCHIDVAFPIDDCRRCHPDMK